MAYTFVDTDLEIYRSSSRNLHPTIYTDWTEKGTEFILNLLRSDKKVMRLVEKQRRIEVS